MNLSLNEQSRAFTRLRVKPFDPSVPHFCGGFMGHLAFCFDLLGALRNVSLRHFPPLAWACQQELPPIPKAILEFLPEFV